MRVWKDAVSQERFAERSAQVFADVIAPRFDELGSRVAVIEDKLQQHLDDAVDRRVREDAAARERSILFDALREHMAKEDARDTD
jgi:hypothetical protein